MQRWQGVLGVVAFALVSPQVSSHTLLQASDEANRGVKPSSLVVHHVSAADDFDADDAVDSEEELYRSEAESARAEDAAAAGTVAAVSSEAKVSGLASQGSNADSESSQKDRRRAEEEGADSDSESAAEGGTGSASEDAQIESVDEDADDDVKKGAHEVEADEADILADASDNERAQSEEEEFDQNVVEVGDDGADDGEENEQNSAADSDEGEDAVAEDADEQGQDEQQQDDDQEQGKDDDAGDDDEVQDAAIDVEQEDAKIESEASADEEAGHELNDMSEGLKLGGSFSILPPAANSEHPANKLAMSKAQAPADAMIFHLPKPDKLVSETPVVRASEPKSKVLAESKPATKSNLRTTKSLVAKSKTVSTATAKLWDALKVFGASHGKQSMNAVEMADEGVSSAASDDEARAEKAVSEAEDEADADDAVDIHR